MSGLTAQQSVQQDGCIYFLVDPRDQTIRYVGKTQNRFGAEERVRQHLRDAQASNTRLFLHKWLRKLLSIDEKPILRVVEYLFNGNELSKAECDWIELGHQLGWPLTNTARGGNGGPIRLGMKNSEEHNRKVGEAIRGKTHSPKTRERIATTKRTNEQEIARFAGLAQVGGQAAAKVRSVPRSCVLCREVVATTVEWRSHYVKRHPDVLETKKKETLKRARDIRWKKYHDTRR